MNRKIRTIAVTMLLMSTAFMTEGCCKEKKEKQDIFSYKNVFLYKGGYHFLSLHRFDEDTTSYKDYFWESSDSTIVSVIDGTVYAISKGVATISASLNGVTYTCSITVSEGNDFTILPDEITLKVGETKDIIISSGGGLFPIRFEVGDNQYYASLPMIFDIIEFCTNDEIHYPPTDEMFTPEYEYDGIKLTGKHEGTTSLRIYVDEIGYDTLIPVTVLP